MSALTSGQNVTPDYVRERVAVIAEVAAAPNDADAHQLQDELLLEVLTAIALGTCVDVSTCAHEAIKVINIEFKRWYE